MGVSLSFFEFGKRGVERMGEKLKGSRRINLRGARKVDLIEKKLSAKS